MVVSIEVDEADIGVKLVRIGLAPCVHQHHLGKIEANECDLDKLGHTKKDLCVLRCCSL